MATRKYVSLNKLSIFLDKLKTTFAYKTDLNNAIEQLNEKASVNHTHDSRYYTKTQVDNMEFITVNDIDNICNKSV